MIIIHISLIYLFIICRMKSIEKLHGLFNENFLTGKFFCKISRHFSKEEEVLNTYFDWIGDTLASRTSPTDNPHAICLYRDEHGYCKWWNLCMFIAVAVVLPIMGTGRPEKLEYSMLLSYRPPWIMIVFFQYLFQSFQGPVLYVVP